MFSDARVIALAERFVPAADEVWRLQRGTDADCRFFQRAVNGGELVTDRGTRQGIWILAPSGRLLAAVHSNRANEVLAAMERGLAAWDALPAGARRLAPDAELEPEFRWEDGFPEGGLALERHARDLPPDLDPAAPRARRSNRDFAWLSADEARAWLPADPAVGATHRVPDALAARLARFCLVDNVRGQTLPFAPEEVREARIAVTVVARRGPLVDLELHGATETVAEGPWLLGESLWTPRGEHPRGLAATLAGRATFDLAAGAFTAFDAVAFARRFGRTPNDGRGRDPAPSALGFHLSLAPPGVRVPPTYLSLYEAAWVARPEGWEDHPENRP